MPIIGRQCTYDLRTVCQRMSEAALPVNHDGPGLTLVYGWATEERRAQGASPSLQGIVFCASSGKLLPFDSCPWCGAKIASSGSSVRTQSAAAGSLAGHRAEPAAPPSEERRPSEPRAARAAADAPAPAAAAPAHDGTARPSNPGAASLKAIRERLGISQAELGEKLGLARSSVANYENGRAPLSQRLLKWMEKHEKKLKDRG